jgi:hypothetical protein
MAYRRGESKMEREGWSGQAPGPEPVVLGDATHLYRGWDRETVFDALTIHREQWMGLHPGEELPEVVAAESPNRVVWSSFWPAAPRDTIELVLDEKTAGTTLRWIWRSPTPPDARGIAITRQRLNTKLGGDIRGWLAHGLWSGTDDEPSAE